MFDYGRILKIGRIHNTGRIHNSESVFWIRVQDFMLNTGPDPDPNRILGLDDQKLEEKNSILFWAKIAVYLSLGHKKKNLKFFWSNIAIYLFIDLHKGEVTGEAFSP